MLQVVHLIFRDRRPSTGNVSPSTTFRRRCLQRQREVFPHRVEPVHTCPCLVAWPSPDESTDEFVTYEAWITRQRDGALIKIPSLDSITGRRADRLTVCTAYTVCYDVGHLI